MREVYYVIFVFVHQVEWLGNGADAAQGTWKRGLFWIAAAG